MHSNPGVLLIQLGTPDAPTKRALKPYLNQFLSDRRVIEIPRIIWLPLLHLRILLTRPKESAKKYARIWHPEDGSPLLHYTKLQAKLLQEAMPNIPVRFGMQIGSPALGDTVRGMIAEGIDRIIALPMYPQYSATTTASATDALFSVLMKERRVPAIRIVPPYYEHPAYLDAMASVIRSEVEKLPWEPDHFLYSFHGIPQSYAKKGDPYPTHVSRTVVGLQKRLQWPRGRWTRTFQSRFGRTPWLKPYTDDVLEKLAKGGAKRVFVALPGFTSDCLETIDEIGHESREVFLHAGGEELHACQCLNANAVWIDAMKKIIHDESQGWF